MPMTIIVTCNVESRVRGFLASTMLELASGVYTAPNMSAAVRERVWAVLERWRAGTRGESVLMTWPDGDAPGGQRLRSLGDRMCGLVEVDGLVLSRRPLSEEELRSLTISAEGVPF